MSKYINADELKQKIPEVSASVFGCSHCSLLSKWEVEEIIDEMPSADVRENTHGEWIQREHLVPLPWDSSPFDYENYDEETHSEWEQYWHCSECDYEASRDWKPRWNYCPNCGKPMRKRRETK